MFCSKVSDLHLDKKEHLFYIICMFVLLSSKFERFTANFHSETVHLEVS